LLLSSKAASCAPSPKERSSQIQEFPENEDSVVEIIPLNRWLKTMSLLPTGLQHELNKNINIPIWGTTTCMCFPEGMCALQSATIANHAKTLFETEEVQLGCQYCRHRLCRVCVGNPEKEDPRLLFSHLCRICIRWCNILFRCKANYLNSLIVFCLKAFAGTRARGKRDTCPCIENL